MKIKSLQDSSYLASVVNNYLLPSYFGWLRSAFSGALCAPVIRELWPSSACYCMQAYQKLQNHGDIKSPCTDMTLVAIISASVKKNIEKSAKSRCQKGPFSSFLSLLSGNAQGQQCIDSNPLDSAAEAPYSMPQARA